jgi:hypothetical protein
MKQREGRAEAIYIYIDICITLLFYTSEISLKVLIQKFKK